MNKLKNILLIDDDPICTWLNKALLEDLDVAQSIDCVSDGQMALDYIQEKCIGKANLENACPDLIFLDLNMPGVDGFEFLERLRSLNCHTDLGSRVVILTTSMHRLDVERAKGYHVCDYLTKPLTEHKVKEVVEKSYKATGLQTFPKVINQSGCIASDRAPIERSAATISSTVDANNPAV